MSVHRSKSTTPRRPPRRRKRMLAIPGASSSDTLTPLGLASPVSPSKTKSGSRRAPPSLRVPPPQKKRNNPFGFYKHEMPRLTPTFSRSQSSKNLPVQKSLQRSKTMSGSNELKKQKKLPVIFELTSPPSRFASSRYTSSKSRLLYWPWRHLHMFAHKFIESLLQRRTSKICFPARVERWINRCGKD